MKPKGDKSEGNELGIEKFESYESGKNKSGGDEPGSVQSRAVSFETTEFEAIAPDMLDLTCAFDDARLVALHIDMQPCFYEESTPPEETPTATTFPVVNQFAKDLRGFDLSNHWVAYTGHWRKSTYDIFRKNKPQSDRGSLTRLLLLDPSIQAMPDELVFEKDSRSAFQTQEDEGACVLKTHLNTAVQDTLIIDGIKDLYCVLATASRAVGLAFRVYIPLDATNCPVNMHDDFARRFYAKGAEHRKLATFTTTDRILSTLAQPRNDQEAMPKSALG